MIFDHTEPNLILVHFLCQMDAAELCSLSRLLILGWVVWGEGVSFCY